MSICVFIVYVAVIAKIDQENYWVKQSVVMVRPFPYPYQAALAINNDLDNTETLDEYTEINNFLNTTKITRGGRGLGLKIGNSFFFYERPSEAISYFNSGPEVARAFRDLMKAGSIDVMHSFGTKAHFNRQDAIACLKELKDHKLKIDVWVDHDHSLSNLGDDVTFGMGGHPDSAAYHADLTLAYGIRFAWMGRVTMIVGQSVPITWKTYLSIFDLEHPFYSLINISKEWSKNIAALLGSRKYAMHKDNELVRIATLDNGMKIYEFMRFDDNWGGVGAGANSKGLAYSISKRNLVRLEEDGGYMIVYTHFGKNSDCGQFICEDTQLALRNLAQEYNNGHIYVTTTSQLLNYYIRHKYLNWSYNTSNDEVSIVIHTIDDPITGSYIPSRAQLTGITFYVPDRNKASLFLNDNKINNITRNIKDFTGKESITIVSDKNGAKAPGD